ncbi:MAG: hypothetical protein IJV08_00825 [Bacteroidaceae bacterium]|nr:hypothetical protein [Bacteroidaceae bacterium]
MGWTEAEERLFYDNVKKARGMEPLKAMTMLTRTCMNYVGVSNGYSTMAYYAGWHWLNVFNKTNHPLTRQTKGMVFCEVMPLICPEYSQEEYENFDIIQINPEHEEQILAQMMELFDEETVGALCMGYWLGNM